ncbi:MULTISPECIES: hypothetical protein [Hyphobacterium]|uniref:Uncharacterized protein n=1 Tax=Hyphobacterium vulgare TaxID=1736751 RepID=A0ABV6ZWU1_9PROT
MRDDTSRTGPRVRKAELVSGIVSFCLLLGVGLGMTALAKSGWPGPAQTLVCVAIASLVVGGQLTPARKWIENDWIFLPACIVLVLTLFTIAGVTPERPLVQEMTHAAVATLVYPVVARFIF